MPTLQEGELGITTDTKKLFYGTGEGGNVEVAKKSEIGDIASQLADNLKNINGRGINAGSPPVPLLGLKGDGTDETVILKNIINYVMNNDIGRVFIPAGTFLCNLELLSSDFLNWNLSIIGVGMKTILKPFDPNKPVIYVSGDWGASGNVKHIWFSGLHLLGDDNYSHGFYFRICQFIHADNCYIEQFRGNAMRFEDAWDGHYYNIHCLDCGNAETEELAQPTLMFTAVNDNSNANKFTNCHFEATPYFIKAEKNSRQNYFVNCKFEKGKPNLLDLSRPISLTDCLSFGFSDCVFTNSNAVTNESDYISDEGRVFLYVNGTSPYESSAKIKKSIKFSSCHFECPDHVSSNWINIRRVDMINCTFNRSEGTLSSFTFENENVFVANKVYIINGKKFALFTALNSRVDADITFMDDTADVGPLFAFSAGADRNIVKYRLSGTYPTYPYSFNTAFNKDQINNRYMFQNKNKIHSEFSTYLTDNTITPDVLYGMNFINVSSETVEYFDYGYDGQIITVRISGVESTTFINSPYLVTKSGSNLVLNIHDTVRFYNSDGVWIEL